MFSQQRICGLLVLRHGIERRFETVFIVTTRAILAGELALVRIRRVTAGAADVGYGLFEVAVLVATETAHLGVCAVEWKLCTAVVEGGRHAHLLPARRVVAALAILLECAPMRILMAIAAGSERESFVL